MNTLEYYLKDSKTDFIAIKASGITNIGHIFIKNNGKYFTSDKIDSNACPTEINTLNLEITHDFLPFIHSFGRIIRSTEPQTSDYYDFFTLGESPSFESFIDILKTYSHQVQLENRRARHFLNQLSEAGI